jgi:nitrile hydratase beta subunit
MDGIHDTGGKLGYRPIPITGDEEPAFHAEWEGRMWGMTRAWTRHPSWKAPKFRHTRELEFPDIYLDRPYLDQWYKAYACMFVGIGWLTVEEIASGRSDGSKPEGLPPPQTVADVPKVKFRTAKVREPQPGDPEPRYRTGDRITARNISPTGHTRLPAYVRGHEGEIVGYHGVQTLNDAVAHNLAEPLYTVRFLLADLFPERAGCPDRVHLDLWESHLAAAG